MRKRSGCTESSGSRTRFCSGIASLLRYLSLPLLLLALDVAARGTTPVVVVTSPANNSQVFSPVHYVASATSSGCSKGIAAIRIYLAPHVSAYTANANHLDRYQPLTPGAYDTVVQAWDNCGRVGKTSLRITVAPTDLRPARFLYVADNSNNRVWGFTVDPSTGRPSTTQQASIATNASYRLASDKAGNRLYVTNAGPIPFGRLQAYFIDRRSGGLQSVPGSPFSLNTTPGPVAVHASGKFVFVGTLTLQPGDGILVFRVNADGSVTLVNSTPIATTSTPDSMVVDRSGKYIYVISLSGNSIDAFEIDTISGALTPVAGSPYSVATPGCINASPSGVTDLFGRFLYTADEGASDVSGYSIATKTGTLTELAQSPFPVSGGCPNGTASPRGIATEPTGRFLYVMNADYFSIYSINAGNGVLKHVKDTIPLSKGLLYTALRTDPSGKYLYAGRTSGSGDKVVGFSIDSVNGDLSTLPGSPFSIGSSVAAFDLTVTQ